MPGADREGIFLFGLLHDCRCQDDGADLSHGSRAATAAVSFMEKGSIDLESNRMALLTKALSEHTFGLAGNDPTICCCWDVDRYDVLRIFDMLKPSLLSYPDIATQERLDAAFYKQDPIEQSWAELLEQF